MGISGKKKKCGIGAIYDGSDPVLGPKRKRGKSMGESKFRGNLRVRKKEKDERRGGKTALMPTFGL